MKVFFGTLTFLLLNVVFVFAQPGEPCGGTDPDAVCPLDTWVFVLAAGALLFTTLHLYRKQKRSLVN